MPHRQGPYDPGARAFKDLLLRIDRVNRASIARTGDIDIRAAAETLSAALQNVSLRRGMLMALAEIICTNLDGSPIDVHSWQPLQHFRPKPEDAQKLRK